MRDSMLGQLSSIRSEILNESRRDIQDLRPAVSALEASMMKYQLDKQEQAEILAHIQS